jgi:hypothetical protein
MRCLTEWSDSAVAEPAKDSDDSLRPLNDYVLARMAEQAIEGYDWSTKEGFDVMCPRITSLSDKYSKLRIDCLCNFCKNMSCLASFFKT